MWVSIIKESVKMPLAVRYGYSQHIRPSNIILIRHAQSIFNAKCHKYPQNEIYSKQAQQQFHHDPQIIDCQITPKARQTFQPDKIRTFFQNKNTQDTIFFVSPMLRALQTAQLILDAANKNYQVKVLPQLSEVLSKICDFSSGINDKKQYFPTFDFRYLDQWILENDLCQFAQNWQDPFVDKEIRNTVDSDGTAGKRYLKALKERFPKPLESAKNCEIRSVEGYKKVFEVAGLYNYKNAVIVSHNRVLKNIQGHLKGRKALDFDNLQIRKVKAVMPQKVDNTANINVANSDSKNN